MESFTLLGGPTLEMETEPNTIHWSASCNPILEEEYSCITKAKNMTDNNERPYKGYGDPVNPQTGQPDANPMGGATAPHYAPPIGYNGVETQSQYTPPPAPPVQSYYNNSPVPSSMQTVSGSAQTSIMSVVGLVLAFVFAPAGLIFSILGLKDSKEKEDGTGRLAAIIGIIVSGAQIALSILLFVFFFIITASAGGSGY